MSARMMPASEDPIRPKETTTVRITVDGEAMTGVTGQSIAGVMMANDTLELRRTVSDCPRGMFCGIGVCFDCLVEVDGLGDVRACQRRAHDGDVVNTRQAPASRPPAAQADSHGGSA